jgi:hypothetical protein
MTFCRVVPSVQCVMSALYVVLVNVSSASVRISHRFAIG